MNTAPAAPYQQYICDACGYIYDEAVGDPDGGLAAGTRYADIPDDWACPLCGVTKADFRLYRAPSREELQARSGAAPTAVPRRGGPAGVLIVGAGRAGWAMAQALRERDASLPITLVTRCAGDVYDKPMLSVAMARQLHDGALVRESGAVGAQDNVKILTSCPSCLQGLSRYTDDLQTGLLEADYIVVEMARQILGEQWLPTYVAQANQGGIERVLV